MWLRARYQEAYTDGRGRRAASAPLDIRHGVEANHSGQMRAMRR
jgi:hypothetical protein